MRNELNTTQPQGLPYTLVFNKKSRPSFPLSGIPHLPGRLFGTKDQAGLTAASEQK